MFEAVFDDGSHVQVNVIGESVTLYQGSGGTQGRGPVSMSPDHAEQLADAIKAAASEARSAGSKSEESTAATA